MSQASEQTLKKKGSKILSGNQSNFAELFL